MADDAGAFSMPSSIRNRGVYEGESSTPLTVGEKTPIQRPPKSGMAMITPLKMQ